MNNVEEKLNKITIRSLSEEEKDSLWHKLAVAHLEEERSPKRLSFNILNFKMKKIIAGVMVLLVILGGTGVAKASNSAIPGDLLFPVDLALEKAQIKIVSQDKKIELKRKFAQERVSEVKSLVEKRGSKDNANTVAFSERENNDVGVALTSINAFLAEDSDSQDKEELSKNFNDLLVVLGDNKNVKIEKKSGEIKIKSDGGKIEIKNGEVKEVKIENSKGSSSNTTKSTTTVKSVRPPMDDDDDEGDIREGDDEEFCRGEWRDAGNCDSGVNGSDDMDDDDGSKGKGSDDDEEDDD